MNLESKNCRILKYMLVLGLAVVFLAIVMLFLGTNVQAIVIVDQAGGGDYLTIQEGVDNAVPGETVYVWDGSYNENITIDKPLFLIGNGSASTIIDGFGTMNNIINITAEGVEITGFNITESGAWYGIWADVGGVNIHDNVFNTQNYAIYVDIIRMNPGSTTIGDIIIDNNEVNGTQGFFFNINFEQPLLGSNLVFGQTTITNNKMYNPDSGIIIDDFHVFGMSGGSITWGDISINDNFINSVNGYGIFFYGYVENLTDVDVALGRADFSDNNVTSTSVAIYMDWWDFYDLYGTTVATAQDASMNDNTVASQDRGIILQNDYADGIFDSASIITGDFFIYNNNITTTGLEGVSIPLSQFGYDMYNDSSLYVGNFYIELNFINSFGSGIQFEVRDCGMNMYDNALASFGNFILKNNNVTSTNAKGIHFYWYQVGYNQYDNSRVTFGEVHVEDNDVLKTGGIDYALLVIPNTVGTQMYGDSFLSLDDWYIEGNTVTSSEMGIETGHETSFYEMYDNSRVVYHDFYVRNNVVDSDQLCMYILNLECGNYMEDFSRVIGGNMSVTGNNVSSPNSYGIQVDYYQVGRYNYDESYVKIGWFDISYNNFSSDSNYGGYVDIYDLGAYMYGSSQAYFGDITIQNNEFWAPNTDGLYLYQFYRNAYEIYDSSYVMIGNFLVNDNYIKSGGYGIYMENWIENAYNMYQSASADLGNFEFNRNIIECANNGINIYFEYIATYLYSDNHVTMGHWQLNDNQINSTGGNGLYIDHWAEIGTYLYGSSTFSIGNFEVLRNTINSNDDGIYASIYDLAYDMYGSSQCYFGDFLFNENTINASGDGIYFSEIDYFACNMYGSSYAEFGNFEVNNNDIIAGYGSALGYDGIYIYFYKNGYNMQGNSEANFGHLQINDNTITCHDEDGIYIWYFYEIGAEMYDNSYFEMGNVEVCRNWVDAGDIGIYLEYLQYLGYTNYDNSQAHFGDFLFNENNITSGSHGILGEYLYYWGYELYGESDAYFGNVEFNNNTVNATGYGIILGDTSSFSYGFQNWGCYLYSSNEVILGHVQINDNDILARNGDGIQVYYFYEIGYEMYMNSYFSMENFEICRNTINASEDGIEMYEIDELAHAIYDNSEAHFRDFLFNDNDIIAGAYGFYNYYIEYLANDMFDNSRAEFGNFEFNRNIIVSGNTGMYFYYSFYENAYYMYDSSMAVLGHYQINDNIITSIGGDGIYFYEFYEIGYEMLDDAYFEMGNFEISRNVINASGYGLYVEEFQYVAYYLGYDGMTVYPGSTTFIIGDILFNDNVIISGLDGITLYYFSYLANELYGNTYAQFGNIEVNSNHITSSGGNGIYIYDLYEWGYVMYDSSQAVFGHIQVNDNNITAGNDTLAYDGIYLWEWFDPGSDMNDLSMLTIGNFEMCRNVIKAGGDGIDIGDIEGLAYFNYDSSVCYFGDLLWNDNVITAGLKVGDGYGITIDAIKFIAYQLSDQSDAYYGNIEFNRNIIHSYDAGIHVYNEYWGHLLYGDNEVIFGHFQINDNTINATNGRGIDMNYFNKIGYWMEGTSTFWMDNFEICRNNIIAGNETFTGNYGIYMEIQEIAYDIEDSAWCHFGDFLFNDNVIWASQYGLYVAYIEYLASYLADSNPAGSCYAEFGNFEFNRNTITSLEEGIYVSDWASWGYDLHHDAEVHFGHIQFNDNWILAGNDTLSRSGIYFSDGPAYEFASNMYGNSYATFKNIEVCRNTINATDVGLDLEYYYQIGYEMYDSSRAEFQDFLVCENDIISGNDGIFIYQFYYVAAYMYDESSFIMGDFKINDNIIEAGLGGSGSGIYLDDWGYNGYDMHNNAYAEFGSFEVCRNWIDPPGYGIYINPYQWGAYMYDQSAFRMGDWLVNDNTVVSSGDDGIYFNSYDFGYENSGTSQAYFGKNEIMYNTVNSTGGSGLYTWWWSEFGSNLYDYAYVEVGSCYIMFNDIISWSPTNYGIYTGPSYTGYSVYDESQAYFGDYIVSDNTIFSNGTYGIYLLYEEVGKSLDTSNLPECRAVVEVGEMRVENNIFTVPQGMGIYFYGSGVGSYLNNYASSTTEGIFINDNTITAFDYGIDFEMRYFGYNIWDESQAILGPVVIDNNDITCTNGTGIYFYINSLAYNIYSDAQLSINDIHITQNTITAGLTGIDIVLDSCINIMDNSIIVFPGMEVANNWVDSTLSAFNYTTINTPASVTGTPTLLSGDVVIQGNTFNGGLFGMFFEWLNPDPTVLQPVFRIFYNDVIGGTTNSTSLYMMNITDTYIETLSIDGYDQGIYVNNSNIWLMFNSTITNVPSYDMNLTSASFIGAVNCTFDKADVYYEDDVSELKVGWFMNVLVITQAGYGVPGAHVVVGDVYSTITFDGSANTLGEAFYRIAWEYLENITGIIDTYNNHTADADKDSVFGFATPDPLMDQTKLVIIILGDSVPPNIFGDSSDTFGTTGDPFNFSIDASDNFGIYRVHVNYQFIGWGSAINTTMSGTGPYDLTIIVPPGFVGQMQYYFSVQDVGDNWVSTGITSVPITDNDAPTINADNSDTSATTGDLFNFVVDATDNVDVTEAHVVWWFDANPQTDDIMSGAGPYDFNVTVPSGSLDDLHYYFRIRDAAGNWIIGTQVNVTVTDNDAPTINADNSDTAATTGEQFFFNVDITDNIGMNETYLVYWFGIDAPTTVPMNGTGPYTYNISVPWDSLDILHYYFTASDIYDNWLFGPQVNVTVSDNDAPTGLTDTSDTQATTGDSFTFEVNATDNIGISEAFVIYWLGTGTQTNTSMTGTGPFNLDISILSDSLDDLHYYFAITDADGNWLVGSQIDITVVDDDAPTIVSDDSDTTASAGKSFYFQVNATDNIGVTEAYVIYWFDSGPETNATMIGAFNRTVIIAPDATTLHYYLAIRDAAGNWESGNQVNVDVTGAVLPDDIPPTLDSDDSDTEATTGDPFEFDVTFTDNIGVAEIHVVYWFDDDTPIDTIISGPYIITIPSDSLDTLHYYFTAEDAAGNWLVGSQVDVDVTDNDAPFNLLDESDTTATTGDSFTFNGNAEDNIRVTSAEVVYWFDSGTQTTTAMTGTDPFTLDITIPSSAGVLHYYLVFYDAEGNSARTLQKDITIADNEPGSISNDASDISGQEGETFRFQVDASDNVGVSDVFAAYWFGDDESSKVLLPLTGVDGTYSGSFVPSDHGTLHYYFMVVDNDGNEFEGNDNTASITEAAVGPGEVTEDEEPSIFPWILVVILIIVVLLLLLLLMRKKGEEPEAIPAETELEDGGGVEGELDEEEPVEGLEEELEAEEDAAIPEEEEGLEGLEEEPGLEEGGESETEGSEEEIAGEEEVIEEEPEEAPKEGEAGEGAALGEITCPNCGIVSSADSEECPICRTKFT